MSLIFISGDRKQIKKAIQEAANGLPIKYSKDIIQDLKKQYGLFYKPSLLYFIYDKNIDADLLNHLINKTKNPVVCIIDGDIDRRSKFCKLFHVPKIPAQKKEDEVSFLYNRYYTKNDMIAGHCINLILTGKLTPKLAIKLYFSKIGTF